MDAAPVSGSQPIEVGVSLMLVPLLIGHALAEPLDDCLDGDASACVRLAEEAERTWAWTVVEETHGRSTGHWYGRRHRLLRQAACEAGHLPSCRACWDEAPRSCRDGGPCDATPLETRLALCAQRGPDHPACALDLEVLGTTPDLWLNPVVLSWGIVWPDHDAWSDGRQLRPLQDVERPRGLSRWRVVSADTLQFTRPSFDAVVWVDADGARLAAPATTTIERASLPGLEGTLLAVSPSGTYTLVRRALTVSLLDGAGAVVGSAVLPGVSAATSSVGDDGVFVAGGYVLGPRGTPWRPQAPAHIDIAAVFAKRLAGAYEREVVQRDELVPRARVTLERADGHVCQTLRADRHGVLRWTDPGDGCVDRVVLHTRDGEASIGYDGRHHGRLVMPVSQALDDEDAPTRLRVVTCEGAPVPDVQVVFLDAHRLRTTDEAGEADLWMDDEGLEPRLFRLYRHGRPLDTTPMGDRDRLEARLPCDVDLPSDTPRDRALVRVLVPEATHDRVQLPRGTVRVAELTWRHERIHARLTVEREGPPTLQVTTRPLPTVTVQTADGEPVVGWPLGQGLVTGVDGRAALEPGAEDRTEVVTLRPWETLADRLEGRDLTHALVPGPGAADMQSPVGRDALANLQTVHHVPYHVVPLERADAARLVEAADPLPVVFVGPTDIVAPEPPTVLCSVGSTCPTSTPARPRGEVPLSGDGSGVWVPLGHVLVAHLVGLPAASEVTPEAWWRVLSPLTPWERAMALRGVPEVQVVPRPLPDGCPLFVDEDTAVIRADAWRRVRQP